MNQSKLTPKDAEQLVIHVVDDAGSGRLLNADPHAIVRHAGEQFKYNSRIVIFEDEDHCKLIGVAVHSYLDCIVDDAEAIQMAWDYLEEIGTFRDASEDWKHTYLF